MRKSRGRDVEGGKETEKEKQRTDRQRGAEFKKHSNLFSLSLVIILQHERSCKE